MGGQHGLGTEIEATAYREVGGGYLGKCLGGEVCTQVLIHTIVEQGLIVLRERGGFYRSSVSDEARSVQEPLYKSADTVHTTKVRALGARYVPRHRPIDPHKQEEGRDVR